MGARLGVPTGFAGTVSHDTFGDELMQQSAQAGLDMRFTRQVERALMHGEFMPSDRRATLGLACFGIVLGIITMALMSRFSSQGRSDYARKLLAAGVNVEHVCHNGMIHNFHAMGAVLPQARLVLSQIGEQVRRAVAK